MKRVLVVEDDVDVRDALAEVLRDAGYDVPEAPGGREALDALRRGPAPAVILLDLMMPDMDGRAFRSAQRGDPRLERVPVILLTADRRIEDDARDLDAAAHVAKPARIDELLAAVERVAGLPQ